MGVANVLAAYRLWGEKLPPKSLIILVYMAARSLDSDEHPWFSLGHEHLAEHALFRPSPITKVDVRAVERAMTPILRVGAVVTDRKASVRRDGDNTARYLLNLGPRDARRKLTVDTDSGDPHDPTKSGADARRKVAARPSVSGFTPVENRRTEEQRQELEEKRGVAASPVDPDTSEHPAPAAAAHPSPESEATQKPPPLTDEAKAAKIVTDSIDATDAEAAAIVDAIKQKKQPRSLVGLVHTIADAGELPTWLADIRNPKPPAVDTTPIGQNLSPRSRENDARRARFAALDAQMAAQGITNPLLALTTGGDR